MLRKLREARDEEGFTLIELLVVVIIIGILAAIAIPVFLNQRERAWLRAADSDLRNTAVELESYFADNNAYPAAITDVSVQSSDGVQAVGDATLPMNYVVGSSNDQAFCLAAAHSNIDSGASAVSTYISNAGGLQETVQDCSGFTG